MDSPAATPSDTPEHATPPHPVIEAAPTAQEPVVEAIADPIDAAPIEPVEPVPAQPVLEAAPAPILLPPAPADAPVMPPHATPKPNPSGMPTARAARPLSQRAWAFAEGPGMKIAGVAIAAGLGWVIGANTFDNSKVTTTQLVEAVNALHTRMGTLESHATQRVSRDDMAKLRTSVTQIEARLEKGRSERSAALTQVSSGIDKKLGESVARMSETGARIDAFSARLDKLEHDAAVSHETTASISKPIAEAKPAAPKATAPVAVAARDNATRNDARDMTPRVPGDGWVLRKVRNGVAYVENRHGVREVEPGDRLPGVGRVENITRRNGQWIVVTSNGVIDAQDY